MSKARFTNSSKLTMNNMRENGMWEIEDTWKIFTEDRFGNNTFRTLSYVFLLKRKPLYVLFNVVLPCAVLFMLELLMFAIPIEAGEKIGLGITLMLSITVFQLVISENLPASSDYFPLISIYLVGGMALSGVALLFTVIVIHLFHRNPARHPVPAWIRRHILGTMARAMFYRTHEHKRVVAGSVRNEIETTQIAMKYDKDDETEWMTAARVLDRFCLVTYTIMSIILTLGIFLTCINSGMLRDRPIGDYGYLNEKHREY